MNGYRAVLLLWSLARIVEDGGCGGKAIKTFMLNGHYVKFPSRKANERLVKQYRYIPQNIIFTRFQLCGNQVFLAVPRYKPGVPFTLGTMLLNDKPSFHPSFDAFVQPFPSPDEPDTGKDFTSLDETLVNVVDLVMGVDGVLWVLDLGVSNTLDDHPSVIGDPKVVGFDANTGTIKHSVSLRPFNQMNQNVYQYLAVEQIKGGNTILYVGDGGTRSIIVWDVQNTVGNRVKLPQCVDLGRKQNREKDVFYLALEEHDAGSYVYMSYTSSPNVFRIKTKHLQKRTHINSKCVVNFGTKPATMVFVGTGYGSIMYFRLRGRTNLYSWDTKISLIEENFKLVRRNRDCRVITHVDVDNEGTLWVMESNIKDFIEDRTGCYGPSILLSPVYGNVSAPAANE